MALFATLLVATGSLTAVASGPVIREEGAVYVTDFIAEPVRLRVLEPTQIYFDRKESRYLGTLRAGQEVELQAISDTTYRVRGQARQGQVVGWVNPQYLDGMPEGMAEGLMASAERKKLVDELIARNEVALGMLEEEVEASLGRPQKKTSRLDETGRFDVWQYVRYERVPQQVRTLDAYGRPIFRTIYVQVPVGELSVIFENNLVQALEQSEGTLLKGDRVSVVPPPLTFY